MIALVISLPSARVVIRTLICSLLPPASQYKVSFFGPTILLVLGSSWKPVSSPLYCLVGSVSAYSIFFSLKYLLASSNHPQIHPSVRRPRPLDIASACLCERKGCLFLNRLCPGRLLVNGFGRLLWMRISWMLSSKFSQAFLRFS